MQRREALAAMAGAGTLAIAGCIGGDNGDGDEIHLEVASFLSEDSLTTARAWLPNFFDKLNDKLDQEVTYDFLGDGSVGAQGEMFELISDGVVDMGIDTPAAWGGQMELSAFMNIPGIFGDDREAHANACGALYELASPDGESGILYEEEYDQFDIRPIMAATPSQYNLCTSYYIEEVSDLEGSTARAGGGINQRMAEALGMGAQEITGGDIDSAFQQGIVDVDIAAHSQLWANNWDQYHTHQTTNLNLGGFHMNWAMADSTFDSLSDEVQEAVIEAGKEASYEYAEVYWDVLDEEMYGGDAVTMDEDEFTDPDNQLLHYETPVGDEIQEIVDPYADEWIQDRDDEGMPASEVVAEFQSNL